MTDLLGDGIKELLADWMAAEIDRLDISLQMRYLG
jgi:hypothetical protein